MFANPPTNNYHPRLALQIGVTGHRDLGLDPEGELALQASISQLLQTIANAYQALAGSETATQLLGKQKPLPPRLLSPLAVGADSLVAQAALANHYELHSPLPFPREVYAEDFQDEALAIFDELYDKAHRKLELDGQRENADTAYRNVGLFVLRHSDVLLAIWNDAEKNDKDEESPGTAGIVKEALKAGVPIVWLHPHSPDAIQVHDPREDQPDWQPLTNKLLTDLLNWRLLPPASPTKPADGQAKIDRPDCCQIYFNHKPPRPNLSGLAFKTLFAWFGKREPSQMWGNDYRIDAEQYQWQEIADAAKHIAAPSEEIKKHFIHADSLASFYADQYRGTFIWAFTLGALAVLLALLGAPFAWEGHYATVFASLELACIAIIYRLISKGRKLSFHQRWVDLRLLAERLRQFAFVVPIGGLTQSAQPIIHSESDYNHALIDWLMRVISRAEGIPVANFTDDYRQHYKTFLLTMINSQAGYHKNNHERNERIVHFLHGLNIGLLVLIVLACFVHMVFHESPWPEWATGFAAVLPAFGAAIFGVLSQGEFERIAKRSKDMEKHLNKIHDKLDKLSNPSISELAHLAHQTTEIMSEELYDWRVIFRAKPLEQHA